MKASATLQYNFQNTSLDTMEFLKVVGDFIDQKRNPANLDHYLRQKMFEKEEKDFRARFQLY